MKKILLLCLISLLLFTGCEFFSDVSKPTVHLISICFSYKDNSTVNNLTGTHNDMNAMYDQLSTMYTSEGYEFSATLIYDSNSSIYYKTHRNGTLSAETSFGSTNIFSDTTILESLIENENIGKDDITIIHYSGHGNDNTGDLVGPYFVLNSNNDTISPTRLLSIVKALKGYKLLLLDSCYSGNFSFDEEGDTSVADAYRNLFSDDDLDLTYTWGAFASSSSEQSMEVTVNKWLERHGAFTAAVLNSLGFDLTTETARTPSRTITVSSLFNDTKSYIDSLKSNSKIITQTTTDSSNFIDLVLFSTKF